ncbi:hypothetical protein ACFQ7F_41545 [Streptomyces sp. NPDC056486]|uniref:hypothetical protein n=1 Tax=Streptomyces sp. NPDC056486 TaxID=3345835 RepID=UPI0036B7C015
MTTFPYSDDPELRPRKITRVGVDEMLHTMRQEFPAQKINLSTDYRIPRQQGTRTRRTVHVNGAHTLDGLLDDPEIRRTVPTTAAVELTQLTVDAVDADRHICVEITRHGVTALIEGSNRDWVYSRSDELRHAVEDGHHPAWAVWRVSRRRGYLVAGLTLDVLAATLTWVIAGGWILGSAAGLTIALIALMAIPAASVAIGSRYAHRCAVKIRKTTPSWFWQRWNISERIAFCAVIVTLIMLVTNTLVTLNSAQDAKGLHTPSRAPNITATDRDLM